MIPISNKHTAIKSSSRTIESLSIQRPQQVRPDDLAFATISESTSSMSLNAPKKHGLMKKIVCTYDCCGCTSLKRSIRHTQVTQYAEIKEENSGRKWWPSEGMQFRAKVKTIEDSKPLRWVVWKSDKIVMFGIQPHQNGEYFFATKLHSNHIRLSKSSPAHNIVVSESHYDPRYFEIEYNVQRGVLLLKHLKSNSYVKSALEFPDYFIETYELILTENKEDATAWTFKSYDHRNTKGPCV